MIAPDTDIASTTPGAKHETAKQWLQRRLRKMPSTWPIDQGGMCKGVPQQRPRTAPSSVVDAAPAMPPLPIAIHSPSRDASMQPPTRPLRPDSGAMRNVDAWLDTSITTPSPPLMGGLPYWRKTVTINARDTVGLQHATPILRGTRLDGAPTTQSGLAKSFRRRAKRVEVQTPFSSRDRPGGSRSRKQVNRRSNSMPAFTVSYAVAQQGPPPVPTLGTGMRLVRIRAPPRVNAAASSDDVCPEQTQGYSASRNSRSSGIEGSTRPSTAAAQITREDSMGDISDVPSYFSGLPPPSYHSRPASMLTTSSFGCIDGMNPAQRQISQQRAAAQRGVRGKLKRLAQSFTSSD